MRTYTAMHLTQLTICINQPMHQKCKKIAALAIASRVLVLAGMVLSDAAFTDLDSSAWLQQRPCDTQCSTKECLTQGPSDSMLETLAPWDSVFFTRIAKCGYETDLINAFFPLVPGSLWLGSVALAPLRLILAYDELLVLAGLLINIIAFVVAALALRGLTAHVLGNESWADLVVIFFCFNPASVFYSAVYTESLFAATSFMGMLLLEQKIFWPAVAVFTLSGAARSNGILLCGYILYPVLKQICHQRRLDGREISRSLIACTIICQPYILMQVRAYATYCTGGNGLDVAGIPVWCHDRLPTLYGYIQARYWNVGFLRFYSKIERWPKILMSAPVLLLSLSGVWRWASANWHSAITLGLLPHRPRPIISPMGSGNLPKTVFSRARNNNGAVARKAVRWPPEGSPSSIHPYIYHWAFMTLVAATVMHVNVATRFLSSCPPLYWYIATWILPEQERWARWFWTWAFGFMVLGTILLPNFYPWT